MIDFCNQSHPLMSKLNVIISSFLLQQIVPTHTHFSHSGTPSFIDLAFLSNPNQLVSCSVISPLTNSDHMGVSINYSLPTSRKTSHFPRRTVWCYSQGDFDKANELIQHTDLENIVSENMTVDVNWSAWQSSFLNIISACVPKKSGRTIYLFSCSRRLQSPLLSCLIKLFPLECSHVLGKLLEQYPYLKVVIVRTLLTTDPSPFCLS